MRQLRVHAKSSAPVIVIILLFVSCSDHAAVSPKENIDNEDNPVTNKNIIGTWRKTSMDSCSEKYPDELEFRESGIYLTNSPAGEYRYWQSGDFSITSERLLKIQTANDAMQSYEFAIDSDGMLSIVDEQQCRVTYVPASP